MFKQVAGGYVFRAPNPRVFGPTNHYLVNEQQRDEIVAIINPRRLVLLLAVWIGGFSLAQGAVMVLMMIYVGGGYPVTFFLVLTAAMLIAAFLMLHLFASRQLRQLQPILAGVAQTDQRITFAEIRQALNQRQSYQQLRRAAMLYAVACVITVASVAMMIYSRKPHASLLSDPLWLVFGFNAVVLGLSSVSSYLNALQKTEHADGIGPATDPIFNKASQYLISAGALALLVFLAVSGWVGVKREYSDQRQGLRYAARGEHDSAIASFSKAITAEPNNADTYRDRAKSYDAKGDHDRAIADYTKAIEIAPGDAIVYRKRADAYRDKGALDKAVADYSKAIELDPKGALAYYMRGLSHAANKNSDLAIADFTKAIEIDPEDAYSYVSRARSFKAKGNRDDAIADFNKAIEINPKYYYAYIFRGDALAARGAHDRAIGDFTKAIDLEPKNIAAYRSRASAYIATGERSLAIADYNAILALPAATDADRQGQGYARQRIDQLTSTTAAPAGSSAIAPALTPR
jgi:tetratricopeptide (TPR) repeat protein